VVGEHAVDPHRQQRVELAPVLRVPPERIALEAVEQR
jgi:hypothetical protein